MVCCRGFSINVSRLDQNHSFPDDVLSLTSLKMTKQDLQKAIGKAVVSPCNVLVHLWLKNETTCVHLGLRCSLGLYKCPVQLFSDMYRISLSRCFQCGT